MSDWIEVTEASTGQKGYLRADLIAMVIPTRTGKTKLFVVGYDDPITVNDLPSAIVARLVPSVESLCPQCGGTGQEIVSGAFAACSTCDGDGKVRT